jgi:MinD-like ATPase involved in chromosome partitioning or flagellar assembly
MTKIISVHSYRGGTGKSNLVANLATNLVMRGQRVAIFDADIQSPGIHVLFGLDEKKIRYTLNDYLWGQCPLVETAYDVSHTLNEQLASPMVNSKSLYLVPSSMKAEEIATVLSEGYDVELLHKGFKELSNLLQLDYLFVDTHPGLSEETLLAIGISDVTIVILRPDYQDYQGTAVVLEIAQQLEVSRILLVLNKVLPEIDTNSLREQVEKIYQVPVAGVLPISNDMFRLASQGIFGLRYPKSPVTEEIDKIVGKIVDILPKPI